MPRCRFGFIHVLNNDYNHWFLYAIGGTSNPTIISQGNRYSAPSTFGDKEVTCRGLLKPAHGKGGVFYVVIDPIDNAADPKPGTLHHPIIQTGLLWIPFKGSMTIKLEQELIVTSDKTIDARGANVEICNGAGITVQFLMNIIIHGLQIHHIIPTKGGKIKDGGNHRVLWGASD
ncbi:hypothetical protein Goklo_023991 [Gossypium klotzschianum]|uniref:Pectate lyase n=1 Tax=Gossypium klotzschianum TaxID=34286 RepID=A0A7J8WEJ2_9ROSI|nr:hypothetical protein [Gossypium klotzschianum]